jgi:hypothetical protein
MELNTVPVMDAIEGMRCDGGSRVLIGCLQPVRWGIRIHVPSKTQHAPGHAQVRITLPLHVCEHHRELAALKLDDLLVEKIRRDVEDFAKKARPIDWKPDFDSAFLQYVDIFGPEYKRFVQAMETHLRSELTEKWGAPVA